MQERPIPVSGPEVRAILDGRKTQARLIIKPQPQFGVGRYTEDGTPGEVDWVLLDEDGDPMDSVLRCPYGAPGKRLWVREARLILEVTQVRVERLQDISEADAIAEGLIPVVGPNSQQMWAYSETTGGHFGDPRVAFHMLWNNIHGAKAWARNPWVCVSNITIEKTGRRFYLVGNTYAIKDELRAAGAKWDADRKAWWTSKYDVAERFASGAAAPAAAADSAPVNNRSDEVTSDTEVVGKCTYKGKSYLLLWSGTTKRGQAAKLASNDGKLVFWADLGEVTVTKRYEERRVGSGRYARHVGGMTFGKLQSLRSDFAEQKKTERKLGAKDGLVGERSDIAARFEGTRHNRTPVRTVGDSQWLKVKGERIAVVVVGYELADYISSDTAEDMGHYDLKSGYYGHLYYRRATLDEFTELQARDPREDAVAPAHAEASR